MLTFFPKPYPDELFYSIIARYHVWSGNYYISDTMDKLFDNRDEKSALLIPRHLPCLANKTIQFGLDYVTLLYEHTIFPYVTCFSNKVSFESMLDIINNNDQKNKFINIYKNNLKPKYLRYCPLCLKEDRDTYGEAYWHRKHQLFGIEMCCKHRCRLKNSNIDVIDSIKNKYIALNILNGVSDDFEQEDISSDCKIELQIALDVDYIFKQYEFIRNIIWEKQTSIRGTIITQLHKRGLITPNGMIKQDKLIEEFQIMYSSVKEKQLIVYLESNYAWLKEYSRGSRRAVSPIRFILFADFLAGSLEAFIESINKQEFIIDRKKVEHHLPRGYDKKLEQYRKRWLNAVERYPNGCRYDLVKEDGAAYAWLRNHDNEWLLNNSPGIKGPRGGAMVLDYWDKADIKYESMVDDAVYQIKSLVGKPVRITKTNISRYMQKKDIIDNRFKFLPRTMYKIEQYIESFNDYQLRKIEWAKNELKKEGRPVTLWTSLKKAGIEDKYVNEFRHLFTS